MPTFIVVVHEDCGLLELAYEQPYKYKQSRWQFSSPLPSRATPTPDDPVERAMAIIAATCVNSGHNNLSPSPAARKKDLPRPDDKVGIRRLLTSHSLQTTLTQQRAAGNNQQRRRRVMACASYAVEDQRRVWSAPMLNVLSDEQRTAVVASGGDFEAVDRAVCSRRRRVVLDELGSARECALAIGVARVGMGADCCGIGGETVLIASPPSILRASLGEVAARLIMLLTWRLQLRVSMEFGEARPLFLAGALLARNEPPRAPPSTGARGDAEQVEARSGGYDPGAAHVDRANVSSYDYSAVLYLNTRGEAFEGGEFAFVDEEGDEVVEPRTGRCVLFASGFEHLHRVGKVRSGSRFVLACWFTLSATAGDALMPACYEMG